MQGRGPGRPGVAGGVDELHDLGREGREGRQPTEKARDDEQPQLGRQPDARRAAARFVAELAPQAHLFGGFNLVLGDIAQNHWLWINNRPELVMADLPAHIRAFAHCPHAGLVVAELPPGVYGLSNAGLDTPWPKTIALRTALAELASAHHPARPPLDTRHPLWSVLANPATWPDADLPATGVPLDWERALSAIWVDKPSTTGTSGGYGTRTSLLMHK